jgi:hypothetical protein
MRANTEELTPNTSWLRFTSPSLGGISRGQRKCPCETIWVLHLARPAGEGVAVFPRQRPPASLLSPSEVAWARDVEQSIALRRPNQIDNAGEVFVTLNCDVTSYYVLYDLYWILYSFQAVKPNELQ